MNQTQVFRDSPRLIVGGTVFYSVTQTLSSTVWHRFTGQPRLTIPGPCQGLVHLPLRYPKS
jgi:hypothetical protein